VSETHLSQPFESTFLQPSNSLAPRTIAFIDGNITDALAVMANVQADVKIFLDATGDGVSQITETLKRYHGLSGIDIISHGDIAALQLGNGSLNANSLAYYENQLQQWRSALAPEADIIFHGCNVAAGEFGAAFIEEIGALTGADIAASIDLTGSSALGGDWDLEFKTGNIETTLVLQQEVKDFYGAVLHAGTPASSLPLLPFQTVGTPIARINTGGGAYVDSLGNAWSADQYFVGSSYSYSINQAIAGTNNSPLYQNERSGVNGSSFSYEIAVAPGIYSINLSFAELYWQQAGLRAFDVDIEGQSFLNDFDIFSQVGAKTALTKSTQVLVTDGILNINFDAVVENPTVGAIEILKAADVPTAGVLAFSAPTYTVNEDGTAVSAVTVTRIGGSSGAVSATLALTEGTAITPADFSNNPIQINFADGDAAAKTIVIPIVNDTLTESTETIGLTLGNVTGGAILGTQSTATLSILDNDGQAKILINSGGGQYVDTAGQTWLADQYFSGSSYAYSSTIPSITNTNNPALFKNERSGVNGGSFGYQVPVTNGTYTVNLNFAELYWDASGKRIFNVKLEGQNAVQNLDIWAQVGKNTALTKSVQAVVVDGILNIDFASTVGDAEITSIEILRTGNVPPPVGAGSLAFSAPTFTVNEDGTYQSAVTVTRTGGSIGAVSATLTLSSNGTASAPGDYNNAPITINFADGDTTAKTVIIPIVNDTLQERVEGVNLTLSNIMGGAALGTQSSATLAIVDNDLNSGFTTLNWATEVGATESTSESLGAVANGKLYLFGGFNTNDFVSSTSQRVSVYNPATNTWKRLGDMPTKLTHSPSVVDGTNIYFIGGYDGLHPQNFGTSTVWKYDTLQDTWTTFVPLPVPKGAGAAVLVGREMHFFGGMNQSRTINSGDHFVLNLDAPNPTWRTAASMPNPRNHLGGVVLGGKIYAVGGQLFEESNVIVQTEVDVYDPATDKWTQVASLPKPRSQMNASTFVMDNRIIVAGGEDYVNHALSDVTAYNPLTNTWTALTSLPDARRSGVAGVIGSEFIYTTGWNLSAGQQNTTWSGLAPTPIVDTIAPTASLTVSSITTSSLSKTFTVTYADNVAVDVTDLDNFDIRVIGSGFNQLASFVSVTPSGSGTPRTATYTITGPGGGWDITDNGNYSVMMEPNQVSDTTNNNFVAARALGTFSVSIPPAGVTPIRVEAESMILNTYRLEANSSASGGQLLSLKNGGATETGLATYSFTGLTGNYNIVIGYYDENDGVAQLSVKKDGVTLDAWSLNQNLGSPDAVAQTFVRRTIATGISIATGSIFQLAGIEDPGEKARIDYIEFIPV
jgi:N-acetylneuraminic acid mutarotase